MVVWAVTFWAAATRCKRILKQFFAISPWLKKLIFSLTSNPSCRRKSRIVEEMRVHDYFQHEGGEIDTIDGTDDPGEGFVGEGLIQMSRMTTSLRNAFSSPTLSTSAVPWSSRELEEKAETRKPYESTHESKD
jgi:hypothetical protein